MDAASLAGDARVLTERIESTEQLDQLTERASKLFNEALDRTGWRDFLSGKWLGHPLHPALTDLPIGFWTSAMLVDFLGGKRSKRAATLLVASGIASAVPTAMAGAHDFTGLDPKAKRVGLVHAAANSAGLLLYIASLFNRMRGRRGRGIYLGVLGAAAATVGGYLGGHLVFGADNEAAVPKVERDATDPNTNGLSVVTASAL